MKLVEVQRRILRLLNQFRDGLPPEQVDDMRALVEAGEPGIALENYCTQLFEYEVSVPIAVVDEVEELGKAMGLDQKYWVRLRS